MDQIIKLKIFFCKKNIYYNKHIECSICLNDMFHKKISQCQECKHYFDKQCIKKLLKYNYKICPMCRSYKTKNFNA